MAKLSSPESVLAKIGEVESRITSLFEAVDHIKKIEMELRSFAERTQGQAEQLDEMVGLSKDRIKEIEGYCESAKKSVDETKAHYGNVKTRIDKAIELVTSGKEDLITLRKAVNEAIRSLGDFKELVRAELDRKRSELEGKIGDFITHAEEQISLSISEGIAKAEEKIRGDANKKIDEFIARQNALIENLNHRFDAQQGFVSSVRLGLEGVAEDLKKVVSAVSNHKAHIHQMSQKLST